MAAATAANRERERELLSPPYVDDGHNKRLTKGHGNNEKKRHHASKRMEVEQREKIADKGVSRSESNHNKNLCVV